MRNVCTPFLWSTPCFDQLGCPYLQVDDLWVNGQVALFFVVESQSYGMRRIHYYDSEITATVNRNLTDARTHHIHDEWQNSHFLYSSMFSVLNIFYIFHHFTFNRNDSRSIFIVNFSVEWYLRYLWSEKHQYEKLIWGKLFPVFMNIVNIKKY